ncbi:hypothetical protein M409DRAFT_24680 [Zasmidium cellare ATCC 36951]|uniref:DUF2306 domain-containing protein n=1 Tax=Zasmidium cellare ATCC 36951 TaxID=1080233 RepID=A0A6A6CCI2_ZASCE|nr:uncharacterized protein M409DRAFT_24680 [Zasmidium cellare ATCC 36951]KAF2164775.1 hypothetical protein M409DRAFT_24680 [Zasmidium cellare ATCC 36951]
MSLPQTLLQRFSHTIGFQHSYNFLLFFIFAGALLGFSLARTPYLNVNGTFLSSAAPGEAYWYRQEYYNIGIHIHLISIISAGLLAVVQFVPVVRHKLPLFHRINGYVVVLLLLTGNVGAVMIARRAFGGTLSTQAGVGVLAIGTTGSAILAYIDIKRLRIDRHRAWMLRCWFYAGSIITLRIIMIIAVVTIGQIGSYYIAMPCRQIAGSGGNVEMYAACREDVDGYAAVHANFLNPMGKEEVAAPFESSFGMALWLALMLHAVGVEVYLQLTMAETDRLRQVSFERQIERGMRPAESASDKLEDRTASAFDHGNRVTSAHVVPGKATETESTLHSDSASEVSKPAKALGWN